MSGVRGYGMPAYSHIQSRICPICGKEIKNFEMHTRNRQDHRAFREHQDKRYRELLKEMYEKYPNNPGIWNDSGILTAINQKAWDEAIEFFGGSSESIKDKELPVPDYAITDETICPKTRQKADKEKCIVNCLDCAAAGSSSHPKYHICMELKSAYRKRKREEKENK